MAYYLVFSFILNSGTKKYVVQKIKIKINWKNDQINLKNLSKAMPKKNKALKNNFPSAAISY